jgi:hypothetical protein
MQATSSVGASSLLSSKFVVLDHGPALGQVRRGLEEAAVVVAFLEHDDGVDARPALVHGRAGEPDLRGAHALEVVEEQRQLTGGATGIAAPAAGRGRRRGDLGSDGDLGAGRRLGWRRRRRRRRPRMRPTSVRPMTSTSSRRAMLSP